MRIRVDSGRKKPIKLWKLIISLIIVLVLTLNVSSSQTLTLKEELDLPANVVHVADLNQDGKNEILVGTTNKEHSDFLQLYRYDKNGYKKVWSYTIPDESKYSGVMSITAGDADNDGQKEIIVSTGQQSGSRGVSKLRIFDKDDGKVLGAFEQVYSYDLNQRTSPGSIKVGDANNDGENEVVVGLSWYSGKILQFKYNASADNYQVSTVQNTGSDIKSINIADVDYDGENEVVVGTSCWDGYDVRILEQRDTYENSWKKNLGYTLATTGNLNNDTKPEILAISGTHCGNADIPQPRVYIFNCSSNFQGHSRYHEMWNESFKRGEGFGQGGCFPVIGDLIGSETNEFVFPMNTNKTHKTVYIYGQVDGQFKQLQTIKITPSNLFIGDSDNNGVNELLICDKHNKKIKIYELQEEKASLNNTIKQPANGTTDVVSSTNSLPGFEFVIAVLGMVITLISRKWR
ncbi:MAG: VCBS repeat-containing protein [Archaeoglobaceae archaeon]